MCCRDLEQIPDVVVVESVVDVAPLATIAHDACGAEEAECLRDLRFVGTDPRGDLVDAQLVVGRELHQHAEPGGVTQQAEEGCAVVDGQGGPQHLHICEDIKT